MGLTSLYQKLKNTVKDTINKYSGNTAPAPKPVTFESTLERIASQAETFTKPIDRNTAYLLETDPYSRECAKKEGIYKVVDAGDFLSKIYEKLSSGIDLGDLTQQKILSLLSAKKECRILNVDHDLESILNKQGISAKNGIGYDFSQVTTALMKSALKNYVEKLKQAHLKEYDVVREWAKVGKYMDKMSSVFYGDSEMDSLKETIALEATKNYVMNRSSGSMDNVAVQLLIGSIRNRSKAFNEKLNYVIDSAKNTASMYTNGLKNSIEGKVRYVKDLAFQGIHDIDRMLHENLSSAKGFYDRQRQYAKATIDNYHAWLNYRPQTA